MPELAENFNKKNGKLPIFWISGIKLRDLWYIVYRNVFILTNGIIFSVAISLVVFGNKQAGIFLGIISVINVLSGLLQDINAWLALEKLQLLTAPRVVRVNDDGTSESILVDEIKKGDRLKLKLGDQIPSDSILRESHNLEINEGLITGESSSIPKSEGELILAGSVVTSGSGVIRAEKIFKESRIAQMTEGIKRYSINLSPIQKSIDVVVKYAGYMLLVVIAFIALRGAYVGEPILDIINNVGAMSSVLVPAGLVFAVTLLFAYGAAHLFRRQVLLQEVNATEKLGRIKNLCMDKTGTLTQNTLTVEKMHLPEGIGEDFAKNMAAAYIQGTRESSQPIDAVKKFIKRKYSGEILDTLNFSSWRRFGAVRIKDGGKELIILAGSPDAFLPFVKNKKEREWLEDFLDNTTRSGKQALCFVSSEEKFLPKDLSTESYSVVAAFAFYNNLRQGIRDTINFFQNRGVNIRIISGDNPKTVSSVAAAAGINGIDKIITGQEMENWKSDDYEIKVKDYYIFARIVPEQKEKIVNALKKDGFTAMIGDGANDALAIKKADLGIAMFDGAPATRQLASVVLTTNSFAALPGGVELADSIITNIEIFSGIFFNVSLNGFFFFIFLSLFGYAFPLTPLNMVFINYMAIGMPAILIVYWSIRPTGRAHRASSRPFLKKILPFAAFSAAVQSMGLALIFLLSPPEIKNAQSNFLVMIAFILFGLIFFMLSPGAYHGAMDKPRKKHLFILGLSIIITSLIVFTSPFLSVFFNIPKLYFSYPIILAAGFIAFMTIFAQFLIAKKIAGKKSEHKS